MKHVYRISLGLLIYIAAVSVLSLFQKKTPDQLTDDPFLPTRSEFKNWRTDPLYVQLTYERIQFLLSQAEYRDKSQRAAQQTDVVRKRSADDCHTAWTAVLEKNKAAYYELLEQAQHAPKGRVTCTICDGFSYMPCVMCKDHSGKCITCDGTGHDVADEYCPACLGTGKCYLCTGIGKMFCPFCDDGEIVVGYKPPRTSPPLY